MLVREKKKTINLPYTVYSIDYRNKKNKIGLG